jgi:hypothetical protein
MIWVYVAIMLDTIALVIWLLWYKIKALFSRFDRNLTLYYQTIAKRQQQQQQRQVLPPPPLPILKQPQLISERDVTFNDAVTYLSVDELIKIRDGLLNKEQKQKLYTVAIKRGWKYR